MINKLIDESCMFKEYVISQLEGSQETDFEQSFITSSKSKQLIK